jgi:hypothetical protein
MPGPASTLFKPLAPVRHCCTVETFITIHMLHLRINVRWSCTFCTQKLDDTVLCVPGQIHECPPLSNMVLCRDHTEQPAYYMCVSWSVVTTVRWHKNNEHYITHNPTIHIVHLLMIQPIYMSELMIVWCVSFSFKISDAYSWPKYVLKLWREKIKGLCIYLSRVHDIFQVFLYMC